MVWLYHSEALPSHCLSCEQERKGEDGGYVRCGRCWTGRWFCFFHLHTTSQNLVVWHQPESKDSWQLSFLVGPGRGRGIGEPLAGPIPLGTGEVGLIIFAPFGISEQSVSACVKSPTCVCRSEIDALQDLCMGSIAHTLFSNFNFVSLLLSRDKTLNAFSSLPSSPHCSPSSFFSASSFFFSPHVSSLSSNFSYSLCLLLTYLLFSQNPGAKA